MNKTQSCTFVELSDGKVATEWLNDKGYSYFDVSNGLSLNKYGYELDDTGKIMITRVLSPNEVLAL